MIILAWAMITVFLALAISEKIQPLATLVLVPIVFMLFGALGNQYIELVAKTKETPVTDVTIWDQVRTIGGRIAAGPGTTSTTAVMLLFAILFSSVTLNVGLFDPVIKFIICLTGGDPVKVLVDTVVVTTMVSPNGDETTTILIVHATFIPIYQKLDLKMVNPGALIVLMNTIMGLLPWDGPTTRTVSVLDEVSKQSILNALLPGMGVTIIYTLGVAYYLGLKERKRAGIQHLNHEEIRASTRPAASGEEALKRPKSTWVGTVLTIGAATMLVFGTLPSVFIFLVDTTLVVLINYRSIKDQRTRISDNAGGALRVSVFAMVVGIFVGLFANSGMSDVLASNMIYLISEQMGHWWGLVTAIISIPDAFFLFSGVFYYGVLPMFAEAGYRYNYIALELGTTSLLGQVFHLLSPLMAFVYLLLNLTGLDMGEQQRQCTEWAVGIFVIFITVAVITGSVPLFKQPSPFFK